jgi:hypothetical protein
MVSRDRASALQIDLDEYVRAGAHKQARMCRDVLRRAGTPTRFAGRRSVSKLLQEYVVPILPSLQSG